MRIGCVLGAYWVRIGCILGAYWVHIGWYWVHIGCILGAYSVHIRCIFGAYSVHIRCILDAVSDSGPYLQGWLTPIHDSSPHDSSIQVIVPVGLRRVDAHRRRLRPHRPPLPFPHQGDQAQAEEQADGRRSRGRFVTMTHRSCRPFTSFLELPGGMLPRSIITWPSRRWLIP